MSTSERADLVNLVTRVMESGETEAELDEALRELESRVLHPRVSDLIFWPAAEGFDCELTAEEVVDIALAYRSIEL